ncbi:MAG: hypothetical protein Q7J35_07265 [Candidatus Methanoperedens sp.]|nr:hypothetical protein [Candidatus Methanoperedens sp.]
MPLNSPGMRLSGNSGASNTITITHGATPEQDPPIDLPQPSLRSDIGAGASRVRCCGISPPQDDQVMRNMDWKCISFHITIVIHK